MDLSLDYCFKVLGITDGCSFQAARKAYKRQMHRLHPDRFPNDVQAQKQASSKFAELKRCFDRIEEYYGIYGEMPRLEQPMPFATNARYGAAPSNKKQAQFQRKTSRLQMDGRCTYQTINRKPVRKKSQKSSSAAEIGAGLFVIGLLAYFVLHPPTSSDDPIQEEESAHLEKLTKEYSESSYYNTDTAHQDTPQALYEEERGPDRLTQERMRAKQIMSKTHQRLDESASGESFTYGSTYKEVASIHGSPDKTDQDIWHYDKSYVKFDAKGRVVDWKSDPSYPLATRLK